MRFLPPLLILFLCTCVRAQIPYLQLSHATTINLKVATTDVEFVYTRPSLRGRTIFGGLEPWDVIWRGGANRNPRLTMSEDFYLGDTRVKAGSYTLFSKPNPDRWTVFLYTETGQYGVPEEWDEARVVATATIIPEQLPRPRETLRYAFGEVTNDKLTLEMEWETTRITIPIRLTTRELMENSIRNTLSGPGSGAYSNAAMYYLRDEVDLAQALAWFDLAIAIGDSPSYWNHLFRAQTLEKMARKEEAKAGARKSMELATASGSEYGITESKAILTRLAGD